MEVNAQNLEQTVQEFNAAVRHDISFNPQALDGRKTEGLVVNKSNWALTIDRPPYIAYPITGGITFTFGGVKVTPLAEVVNVRGDRIEGLYASGETIGGIFWHNYPGATSVLRGAVFGRIAGRESARRRYQT
jgi:tricarballylate dehydrogenase